MRQATCSGMAPEHGPLFPRPDSRGQGSPALPPQDFGHHFPKAAAGLKMVVAFGPHDDALCGCAGWPPAELS